MPTERGTRRRGRWTGKGLWLVLLLRLCLSWEAEAQDPVLVGEWPGYARRPFNVAAAQGRYAYVQGWGTQGDIILQVLDLQDPTRPRVVHSQITTVGYVVKVAGRWLYGAGGNPSFRVFDLSNPTKPEWAAYCTYPGAGSAYGAALSGSHVYVAAGGSVWPDRDGLQIIDVSDPTNPFKVGNIDSKGESGNGARGVAVAGRYAYLADATAGLQIIDVADPANPARLASVSAGLAWDVAVRGNYAFVADNKAGYVGSEGIVIVDVSNPARPVRIGNYATVPEPWNVLMVSNTLFACTLRLIEALDVTDPLRPRSLGAYRPILGDGSIEAIWGGYMMVSSGFEGLELVDVRDPTSLSHLGFLDMSGSGEGVAASGGLAFLADGQTLYIIDVRDPTQPTLVGQLALGAPMRRVVLSG